MAEQESTDARPSTPAPKLKFSFTKLIFGNSGIVTWWKTWGTGVRLAITSVIAVLLIFGGVSLWQKLFPKPMQNINQPTITVGQGGVSHYTVVQSADTKKPLIRVVPYMDANGGWGKVSNEDDNGGAQWQAVAGVRLEMDGIWDALFQKRQAKQTVVSSQTQEGGK